MCLNSSHVFIQFLLLFFSVLQQRDGQWHQVRFLFRVTDPILLPITHIANLPEATPASRYHLEVGPVCFL